MYRRVVAQASDAPSPQHLAETWRDEQRLNAEAIMRTLPAAAYFSRYTAAVLWGLPVPVRPHHRAALDVGMPSTGHWLTGPGLLGHRASTHLVTVTTHQGAPLSDPASTWAMLAPELSHRDAIALGDAVIRRDRIPGTQRLECAPLASLDDLAAAASARYRRGGVKLRVMLPLLSSHSASPPETHLRLLLQSWGLSGFALDFDVWDDDGRLAGCSEIAFPAHKLALEYEGRHHLLEPRQWNRDIEKYRRYAQLGWEVIRVTAELLYLRPLELRAQIVEALGRSGGAEARARA